jgi:hypothetical protein
MCPRCAAVFLPLVYCHRICIATRQCLELQNPSRHSALLICLESVTLCSSKLTVIVIFTIDCNWEQAIECAFICGSCKMARCSSGACVGACGVGKPMSGIRRESVARNGGNLSYSSVRQGPLQHAYGMPHLRCMSGTMNAPLERGHWLVQSRGVHWVPLHAPPRRVVPQLRIYLAPLSLALRRLTR